MYDLDNGDELFGAQNAGPKLGLDGVHVDTLLGLTQDARASDLHITVNAAPTVRIDGRLKALNFEILKPKDTKRLIYDILTEEQQVQFNREKELDFSYSLNERSRFRVNVFIQRGSMVAAFRLIPAQIPSIEDLCLPPLLKELAHRQDGLILVTGPTGCGKSTTIASMIDVINKERDCHIVTIEDPIEYLHVHKMSLVNQRELGQDTNSFKNALRAVLREDPDVVLIGEMRDLDTISAALTLAETGHLVFGSLHTRNAPQAIERIVDVFPPHQQEQVRVQLANTLEAVIAQQLIPKIGGGRFACTELMVVNSAIRCLIREGKTHQISSVIETGGSTGMRTMDSAIKEAIKNGIITAADGARRAIDPDSIDSLRRAA